MTRYGTLTNDTLTPAPPRIVLDGWQILNPTDAQYEASGYLQVRYTDAPVAPDGYYPVSGWEEQDGEIVQVWHFEPNPEPTADESLTRYINERTGANDPDLVSAAETLIRNNMEE